MSKKKKKHKSQGKRHVKRTSRPAAVPVNPLKQRLADYNRLKPIVEAARAAQQRAQAREGRNPQESEGI